MKRKQYLFSSEKIDVIHSDFICKEINGHYVYIEPSLNFSYSKNENVEILILGLIINPFQPQQTSQEIVDYLSKKTTKESFLSELENYSGRYVVFYNNEKDFIALTDFIAQRNLFYWFNEDKTYFSSCEKLLLESLNLEPEISEKKSQMLNDVGFVKIKEHWLLGEDEWDDRFRKLLPNHFIDISRKSIERLPIYHLETLKKEQLIELCTILLQGTIEGATIRFDKIYEAITAGYDSRLVLAASYRFKEKIDYFLFDRKNTNIRNDIRVAKKLSKKLNFKFQSIVPNPVSEKFRSEFEKEFIISRNLPKHQNIEYFKNFAPKNAVNISGDGGEIIRNYRVKEHFRSIDSLLKNLSYQAFPYNVESLNTWFEESKNYRDKYGLEINDQFEIEIAMSKWAAKGTLEQDFSAVEELTPYNNRRLIYSILLNTSLADRSRPNFPFICNLMESMLPGSTSIPFNPPTWKDRVKKILKR